MSWRASGWVKYLRRHADGTLLTAREKLVLFVLGDDYNDEKGFAWSGLTTIADNALTSRRHVIDLLASLEKHGTIAIERRKTGSNLYRFPGLNAREPSSLVKNTLVKSAARPVNQLVHQASEPASAPEPTLNLQKQQKSAAKPAATRTRFPEGFSLTFEMQQFATENGVAKPHDEFAAFSDFHQSRGNRFIDWVAAWRTWCRQCHKFASRGGSHGVSRENRPARNAVNSGRPEGYDRDERIRTGKTIVLEV